MAAGTGADGAGRYRTWLEGVVGVPATEGNQVEVLRNGDQIFAAMLEGIRSASRTVDLATFIFQDSIASEFADALCARSRAGVRVRVLLDALGAGGPEREAVARMRDAGARVELFRPLRNPRVWESFHRAHRKILVCDEQLAFTGGVGIADRWRGDARGPSEWRDTHFRIRGPAVDGLIGAFVHNWAETGQPLFDERDRFSDQPRCGSSTLQVVRVGARTGWGAMSTLVWSLLRLARRRVRIATAYFAPDHEVLSLLEDTASRGVDVTLLVNGANADKRLSLLASQAQFERLLGAGVRVYCYQPTMLHLKAMTVDAEVASVGSANFNFRSLMLDEEVNAIVFDPDIVGVLDDHFEDDLSRSQAVDLRTWVGRDLGQKTLEAVPGLLSRHL